MADVIRVSIKGTMPSGEVWSVNPVYKVLTGSAIGSLELAAAATAINALSVPSDLLLAMATSCAITGVQLEARTHEGVLESQAEGLRTVPLAGTGTVGLPFQSSIVCSLRTVGGGTHGRGRLYWPATGMTINPATLRITSTPHAAIVGAFKTYLTAVQTALDASVDETVGLAVWSRTTASSALVAQLRVGDVLDVQRRRRDAVPETYKDVSYV